MSYIDKISVGGTVYDIQDSNAAPQTEVDDLKSAVANVEGELYEAETVQLFTDQSGWTRNTIGSSSTLTWQASTTRIAVRPTFDISNIDADFTITPTEGYKYVLAYYNASSSVQEKTSWISEVTTHSKPNSTATQFTMLIAKSDDSAITTDDYDKVTVTYTAQKHIIAELSNTVDGIETDINTMSGTITSLGNDVDAVEGAVESAEFKLAQFSQDERIETLIKDGNLISFDDYELVEYVSANAGNNNTVKIDTGLYLGPNLRTELDMQLTSIAVANYSGREAVSGKYIRNSIGVYTDDLTKFYYGFGDQNLYYGTSDTNRHLFYIDVPNLCYGYDDYEQTKTAFTYGSQYASYPLYLFGCHNQSSTNARAKIYKAKYYNSGTLVAYFVPVKRLSDNRAGFYDVIRGAFYTNAGSGTLTAGPSKNNSGTAEPALLIKKTEITDAYSAHFDSAESVDGYLFFTDPHIYRAEVTEDVQMELFKRLELAYNSTPTRFMLCGGDWLQGGEQDVIPGGPTPAQACGQLGYVTGVMGKLFKNYYPMFGNHDGNYKNTALSRQTVINLMFPEQGKCYYTFKSGETRYYIFDTTTDLGLGSMTDYKKEQLNWFVAQLLENTGDEHIVIGCHVFTDNYTSTASDSDICLQMKDALAVANAYNLRIADYALPWATTTIKDFSGCTGTIHYCIAGHTHHDLLGEYAGIPVLITQNALHNYAQPTFDLVAFDHDSNTLYTNRIGNGANRILHCAWVTVSTTETLTPAITGTLTWASLDDAVATVTGGTVTAVSSGYALISAANENGEVEAWVVAVS